MARYYDEYQGMSSNPREVRGMDPNHRGGYRGLRWRGEHGQAPYGWHRWRHAGDLEGSGGYYGRAMREGGYVGEFEAGHGGYRHPGAYDRDLGGGGGVHDFRAHPEHLHDFNANSPAFHPDYSRPATLGRSRGYDYDFGYRFGHTNRGLSRGGFSQGWAWGPMRGAR